MTEAAGGAGATDEVDDPPKATPRVLGIKVGDIAQALTVLGGLAYAFGWILTSRFYGALGIAPEEVGISPAWLAARTLMVVVAGVAISALGILLIQKSHLRRRAQWDISTRGGIVVVSLALTALPVGVAYLGLLLWANSQRPRPPLTVPFLCLALVWIAFLWMFLRLRGTRQPISLAWNFRLWYRLIGATVIAFVSTLAIAFPFVYSDRLSEQAKRGSPVEVAALPGIAGLRVEAVRIYPIAAQSFTASSLVPGRCYLRLGSDDGTTVLYDYRADRALRIGNSQLVSVQLC